MSKHTPGPWTYTKCPCNQKGCSQFTISTQGGVGFEEADARLISAAPDLLEALKGASKAIREYRSQGAPTAYWDDVEAQAKAAIAKAEGV
jgi:hypothetical protein